MITRKALENALWTVLALVAAALPLALADRGVVPLDEGQLVQIADRLVRGEVLYRDVFTGITPAVYYLAAGLLALFGRDILVLRLAELVVLATTVLALWRIGLRVANRFWALLAPLGLAPILVWTFPSLTILTYSSLGLALALGCLLACLRLLEAPGPARACVLGLCLGLLGMTKQNYAVLVLTGVGYSLVQGWRVGIIDASHRPARLLAAMVAPVVVLASALFASFAAARSLSDLLRYTIVTLFATQTTAFDQPIPPIFGHHPGDFGMFQFLYAPPGLWEYWYREAPLWGVSVGEWTLDLSIRLTYGVASALALAAGAGAAVAVVRAPTDRRGLATASVQATVFLFFLGIYPSAVSSHLAMVAPPLLLMVAIFADRMGGRSALARAVGLAVALAMVGVSAQGAWDLRRWNSTPLATEGASIRTTQSKARTYDEAAAWLRNCAAPAEPVLVAPDLALLYFLADRPNPTPYDLLIPGDIDEDVVVRRAADVRCAVFRPGFFWQFGQFVDWFPKTSALLEREFRTVERIPADPPGLQMMRRTTSPR